MNKTTLTALALAGFTLTPMAHAVQVGELRSLNGMGQPFEGFVPIVLQPGETLDADGVRIRPDAVSWSDVHQLDYLRGMQADIVEAGDGRRYLRLTNMAPLNLPLLSFRVHLDAGRIGFVRSYAVAPPPPVPMVADATARPAPAATGRPVVTDRGTKMTVRPGQTLSGIAREIAAREGGAWRDVMTRLHARNPDAFIGGDIDRLIAGATLDIGSAAASTLADAPPHERTRALRETVTETGATAGAPEPPAATVAAVSPRPARVDYDPAVRELLEASSAMYAEIRALYGDGANDDASPRTAARPASVNAADTAPAVTAKVSPDVTAEGDAPAPAVAEAADPVPTQATQREPAATPPTIAPGPITSEASLVGMLVRLVAPVSLAAVLAVGLIAYRRRQAQAEARASADAAAREAERRAQVSEKARALTNNGTGFVDDGQDDEAVEELDSTGDLVAYALRSIDDAIAHGRYERAETDLKAVIRRAPKNWQALLRLSEVYYITEKRPEFEAVASELHAEHRAEMPADDWAKLMRMGKVLVPTHPLFGGPALVEARTA